MRKSEIKNMVMQNERGQNTHDQGERVKIPLLPSNVSKKSYKDSRPQQGHDSDIQQYAVQIPTVLERHLNEFKDHNSLITNIFLTSFKL